MACEQGVTGAAPDNLFKMDLSLTTTLTLGFILGMTHATDADHVAAMSTLVSRHRSIALSVGLGTCWGAGHTLALLLVGVGVIAFQLTISPALAKGCETLVGLLLIGLGGDVLFRTFGSWTFHRHQHQHDGIAHSHLHLHGDTAHAQEHVHWFKIGTRPFLIGVLHGMAGSAALMLLVLTTIPSMAGKFLYLLVFGVGCTGGMLVLSGLMGIPFATSVARSEKLHTSLQMVTGMASISFGLSMLWTLLV